MALLRVNTGPLSRAACSIQYTKARDQKRLAKDAFALIGGTQGEQILANPTEKLARQANN